MKTPEARMDFGLADLEAGQGGVAQPPDTDTRAYLVAQK
jgi:hypothetical protein